MNEKQYLRAQLEEVKIELIEQGCQTVGDAMKRNEEAFGRMVDLCLALGHTWSADVLFVAGEIKRRQREQGHDPSEAIQVPQ